MATTVQVEKQGELIKAWIDGRPLKFGPSNKAAINVNGKSHVLTWVALGAPGEAYAIKVTKPKEAEFSHEATFDDDKKDAGVHWFAVEV